MAILKWSVIDDPVSESGCGRSIVSLFCVVVVEVWRRDCVTERETLFKLEVELRSETKIEIEGQ